MKAIYTMASATMKFAVSVVIFPTLQKGTTFHWLDVTYPYVFWFAALIWICYPVYEHWLEIKEEK